MKTKTLFAIIAAAALFGLARQDARGQDIDSIPPVVVKTVPEAGLGMFRPASAKSASLSARKCRTIPGLG